MVYFYKSVSEIEKDGLDHPKIYLFKLYQILAIEGVGPIIRPRNHIDRECSQLMTK